MSAAATLPRIDTPGRIFRRRSTPSSSPPSAEKIGVGATSTINTSEAPSSFSIGKCIPRSGKMLRRFVGTLQASPVRMTARGKGKICAAHMRLLCGKPLCFFCLSFCNRFDPGMWPAPGCAKGPILCSGPSPARFGRQADGAGRSPNIRSASDSRRRGQALHC